jgi:hypothetical protein
LEGGIVGDVVDDDCTVGVSEVGGDETPEFLLAGRVPEEEAVHVVVVLDVF